MCKEMKKLSYSHWGKGIHVKKSRSMTTEEIGAFLAVIVLWLLAALMFKLTGFI